MHKVERHRTILSALADEPYLSVESLAGKLQTSAVTVRRDLTELAARGQVTRVHGGAQLRAEGRRLLGGTSFKRNATRNIAAKRSIAKAATRLCRSGDSVIIDGGTTTFQMSRYLKGRDLQVLTNSIHIVQSLIDEPGVRLIMPAGEVYREQNIVLSPYDIDGLSQYRAGTMFMGAEAVSAAGILQTDPLLIRAEQRLRRLADRLVVLVDHSKFGADGHLLFCPLEEVDVLITDSGVDPKALERAKAADVEVIVAD